MTQVFSIILLIACLISVCLVFIKIRRSQMKIEYALFWIVFTIIAALLAIFPDILTFAAELLGVRNNMNLLFFVLIFVAMYRVFSLSIKMSALETKLSILAQKYAILKNELESKEKEALDKSRQNEE